MTVFLFIWLDCKLGTGDQWLMRFIMMSIITYSWKWIQNLSFSCCLTILIVDLFYNIYFVYFLMMFNLYIFYICLFTFIISFTHNLFFFIIVCQKKNWHTKIIIVFFTVSLINSENYGTYCVAGNHLYLSAS